MLRFLALAVALAASGDVRPPQHVTLAATGNVPASLREPLPLHIGGRVERGGAGFRHQWPGIYAEAAFRGEQVALRFDDAVNEWRVSIDDAPPVSIDRPGKAVVVIDRLSAGAHRIRIDKMTESAAPARFGGLFVGTGDALPAPAPRRRQIEFIGDSSMAGYGARSERIDCTPEQVRATTDTPDAFAALTARHYDADYQVNAVSGRGLIRNFGGTAPDATMERLWPRRIPNEPFRFTDRGWQPQIVMLKLQADFVGFQPDLRWPTLAALAEDYAKHYGRLLAQIHGRYPRAVFILWWFGRGDPMLESAERRISDAARAAGVRDVLFLPFPSGEFRAKGCHGHYGVEEQRRIADWLIREIDAHPDFWQGYPI